MFIFSIIPSTPNHLGITRYLASGAPDEIFGKDRACHYHSDTPPVHSCEDTNDSSQTANQL